MTTPTVAELPSGSVTHDIRGRVLGPIQRPDVLTGWSAVVAIVLSAIRHSTGLSAGSSRWVCPISATTTMGGRRLTLSCPAHGLLSPPRSPGADVRLTSAVPRAEG